MNAPVRGSCSHNWVRARQVEWCDRCAEERPWQPEVLSEGYVRWHSVPIAVRNREIRWRRYGEGRTLGEIACSMGMSISAVRHALSRSPQGRPE